MPRAILSKSAMILGLARIAAEDAIKSSQKEGVTVALLVAVGFAFRRVGVGIL